MLRHSATFPLNSPDQLINSFMVIPLSYLFRNVSDSGTFSFGGKNIVIDSRQSDFDSIWQLQKMTDQFLLLGVPILGIQNENQI